MKPPSGPVIPIQPVAPDGAAGGTVSLYQKAAKVYPRSVQGRFAAWRWALVWLTQLAFYGLPWLSWNGRQALLFDLNRQRFFLFGGVFQPQDLVYLAALLVLAALLLFFVTALAGRIWCGYACPQTVYTEIFLWVERRLEGDRLARMRLDAAPWGWNKLARKGGKQTLWLLISLATGFSFVGYFTPIRELAGEALALAFSPWEWFWVLFYGFATYGNAGYLREQVCKYMCPYARFQSALIDPDSLIIAYDHRRGETRGARPRQADPKALGLGDCVACTLCVQVCPTGIDIRKGLQNECIGCAACIDVCDAVMGKMGYAKGLIRYATEQGLSRGLTRAQMLRRVWRPRVLLYGLALLLLGGAFLYSLAQRPGFAVDVMRDRGALARVVDEGVVENSYRLQLASGREQALRLQLTVSGLAGLRIRSGATLEVAPTATQSQALTLALPPEAAAAHAGKAVPVVFEVRAADGALRRVSSTFFVPR